VTAASQPRSRAAALGRALSAIAGKAVAPADAGGVVYGAIVIGALLAAESGSHDGYAGVLESGLVAACLYWLAHAYATLLGQLFAVREHLTARALGRALAHDVAIVRGAAIPLLAVLIAWGAGAASETAVTIALWCSVATVAGFNLAAGIRAGARRGELALELLVGVAMGGAIVALKVLLHK